VNPSPKPWLSLYPLVNFFECSQVYSQVTGPPFIFLMVIPLLYPCRSLDVAEGTFSLFPDLSLFLCPCTLFPSPAEFLQVPAVSTSLFFPSDTPPTSLFLVRPLLFWFLTVSPRTFGRIASTNKFFVLGRCPLSIKRDSSLFDASQTTVFSISNRVFLSSPLSSRSSSFLRSSAFSLPIFPLA